MDYLFDFTGPSSQAVTRRRLLQSTLAPTVGMSLLSQLDGSSLRAQEAKPLNRFPRMVHSFMVAQARQAEKRKLRTLESLRTKADAEAHVKSVREKIRRCFGPEPERTPLNPRITGVVERPNYRIENVIFESRPGFPVTANLYIPKQKPFPLPAVVGTCGHSSNGKAAGAYQSFAQGLAKLGYVCLIYDPIGQGERLQYVKDDLTPLLRPGTREHLHAGNQQFLVGDFFGMWRAWDGIRALDYLLTRKEVDPKHIGVTGNSGGGTMTTWLCGVEPRWTMAAPSCFVTTFRRNLENELAADTEQCPPRVLAEQLDHDDFIAAMAPQPAILLAKERDYFDVRGTNEAYQRLKKLYRLLGHEENISMFVGPTYHGYSQENREAMYQWFNRATRASSINKEPDLQIEEDKTLWCTPQGQVAGLKNTRTVFQFTAEKSRQLAARRKPLESGALQKSVSQVLKIPRQAVKPPHYRIWRYLPAKNYPTKYAIAYGVESEAGIQAVSYRLTNERLYSRPPQGGKQATLYVSHLSSDEELRSEPLIAELVKQDPEKPFFTCDVRGIGESRPGTGAPGSFHQPYGNDYFYAIHSLMLDRPYLGQKTFDVLRVLQWLETLGHQEVHLVGKGWGALAATFAGLLSKTVTQVTLKNALRSYAEVAQSEHYTWPLSTFLPDVLSHFDLPDCYRELTANKKLRQLEPWGADATMS